jgi:hypothetical protein
MILASGEGQLFFLVIMAVIGLINWASGKLKEGNKPPQKPGQPGGATRPNRPASGESEDERMRRFLEALGVPTDERPSPPQRPAEQRPARPAAPPPLKTARRQPRQPASPPPLQTQRRAPAPEEPMIVTQAEKVVLPDLAVPAVPEFETITSRVSAVPSEPGFPRAEAGRTHGPSIGDTLRAALASPQQLRSAFILAEVFGTPPGLRQ